MTTPTFNSIASVSAQPRQFLEYLYQAAVTRAVPRTNADWFYKKTASSAGSTCATSY